MTTHPYWLVPIGRLSTHTKFRGDVTLQTGVMDVLRPANRKAAGAELKNTTHPYWLVPIGRLSTHNRFRDDVTLQIGVMDVLRPANRKAAGAELKKYNSFLLVGPYWPSKYTHQVSRRCHAPNLSSGCLKGQPIGRQRWRGLKNTTHPYWLVPIGRLSTLTKFRDDITLQTGHAGLWKGSGPAGSDWARGPLERARGL